MIFLVAFIITGIVIVGGTTLFLTSQKDDSKVAEVITQETDPQITKEVVTIDLERSELANLSASQWQIHRDLISSVDIVPNPKFISPNLTWS